MRSLVVGGTLQVTTSGGGPAADSLQLQWLRAAPGAHQPLPISGAVRHQVSARPAINGWRRCRVLLQAPLRCCLHSYCRVHRCRWVAGAALLEAPWLPQPTYFQYCCLRLV